MEHGASPAARALLALEAIGSEPGITAGRLGERLGVTERAARRYVAILREAELPIESVSGPHGGYRVGRGLRLPPLTFTAAEAMGLVMAVLEGHPNAADPADLVGRALAKILRVLPERVAAPVRTVRDATAQAQPPALVPASPPPVSPELVSRLIESCTAARRLRLTYRMPGGSGDPGGSGAAGGSGADREMEVEPWAVVLRRSLWYLLCWSRTQRARRALRVDRIVSAFPLTSVFTPPAGLDALRVLEEHLSQGWDYQVDVTVHAPVEDTARWLPRSLALLEPDDGGPGSGPGGDGPGGGGPGGGPDGGPDRGGPGGGGPDGGPGGGGRTRLRASTSNPDWYARQLATLPVPFRVRGAPELRKAVEALAHQLLEASSLGSSGDAGRSSDDP